MSCLFYASNIKELQKQSIGLLDSLVVHLTLISLSHYTNQDESKISSLNQSSNVFVTSASAARESPGPQAATGDSTTTPTSARRLSNQFQSSSTCASKTSANQSSSLDFMILVDCLFDVLCNDDAEYWSLVQRAILILIETSEIVTGGASLSLISAEGNSKESHFLKPNLANLALFDYLAEKMCQLCYERSWYAKKAGYTWISLSLCFNCGLTTKKIVFVAVDVSSYDC